MPDYLLVLLVCLAAVSLLNLFYYLGFFRFAFDHPKQTEALEPLPVSVVICAKNEAENLRKFLPDILSQEHDNFEVVVINDASIDETLEVMEDFQRKDPRVQIVNVKNIEAFWGKKKYALTLGIKKVRHPYLLFTDADCCPESKHWISEMSSNFQSKKSIVLGYGGYFVNKRSFLNKLIRFETLLTAIQYFSYAKWGIPYMGVGRNLAYTSEEFYRQTGFASHLHIQSGDDDLFVNEAATATNTAICFSKDSITRSVPKSSFKAWFRQKRRHVSTARFYKKKHQFLLGLFYCTQFLFWLLLIPLLFSGYWLPTLIILGVRLVIQAQVFFRSAKKLQEMDLFWIFPFLEVFLVCTQFGIFISNSFSKPTHWK